jgi:hypothetical protein
MVKTSQKHLCRKVSPAPPECPREVRKMEAVSILLCYTHEIPGPPQIKQKVGKIIFWVEIGKSQQNIDGSDRNNSTTTFPCLEKMISTHHGTSAAIYL